MEPSPIPPLSPHDAEVALEHAREDADWLASLRRAYRGRHDVLDALWWVAHPLAATPGGLVDPAVGLRDLQSAVFSRASVEVAGPDSDGALRMREVEHQLRERQRLLAEDARFLEQAWFSVHPTAIPPDEARRDQPDQTHPAEPDAAPRRKLLLPALAGVGLLAAILGLPPLTGIDAGAEREPTPIPTTPATTPHARVEIVSFTTDGNVSDPQAVLSRPAVERDRPRFELVGPFEPGSFRSLPDLVGHLELYLARGEEADSVCLVVMRHNGTGQSSCVEAATFAQHGIELGASGDRYQIGVDVTILSESFTLLANGDFHYEARARVPENRQELP